MNKFTSSISSAGKFLLSSPLFFAEQKENFSSFEERLISAPDRAKLWRGECRARWFEVWVKMGHFRCNFFVKKGKLVEIKSVSPISGWLRKITIIVFIVVVLGDEKRMSQNNQFYKKLLARAWKSEKSENFRMYTYVYLYTHIYIFVHFGIIEKK